MPVFALGYNEIGHFIMMRKRFAKSLSTLLASALEPRDVPHLPSFAGAGRLRCVLRSQVLIRKSATVLAA